MNHSLSVRISDTLNIALEQKALNMGIKKSELLRKALQAYLDRNTAADTDDELQNRLSYLLIILQQPPEEKTWKWLQEEVERICQTMTENSVSCDG